jgi:hypothetical protein
MALDTERAKCSTAVLYIQRRRITGFSYYNVTPLPKYCCSTSSFTTVYKRLPEGGHNWIGKGLMRRIDGGLFDELIGGRCYQGGLRGDCC